MLSLNFLKVQETGSLYYTQHTLVKKVWNKFDDLCHLFICCFSYRPSWHLNISWQYFLVIWDCKLSMFLDSFLLKCFGEYYRIGLCGHILSWFDIFAYSVVLFTLLCCLFIYKCTVTYFLEALMNMPLLAPCLGVMLHTSMIFCYDAKLCHD